MRLTVGLQKTVCCSPPLWQQPPLWQHSSCTALEIYDPVLFVWFLLCQDSGGSAPFSAEPGHEPTRIYPTQSQAHDQCDGKQAGAELDLMHANLQLQGGETHLSSCSTHTPSPKAAFKPQAISFHLHVQEGGHHSEKLVCFLAEAIPCHFSEVLRWLLFLSPLPITTTVINEDVGVNSQPMSQEKSPIAWAGNITCTAVHNSSLPVTF